MLKYIRILLITLFVLALAGSVGLYFYTYTHEDVKPPAFRLNEELIEISVKEPKEVLLEGVSAYDNVDGDLTDKIRIKEISQFTEGTDANVTYIVFDRSSNYATCTRTVRYSDYMPPRFVLTKPMSCFQGETINYLERIQVNDVIDGNISGKLKLVETTTSSSIPGTYSAIVSVTNSMGDTVELPLTVQVLDKSVSRPTVTLKRYLAYVKQGDKPLYRDFVASVTDPMDTSEVRIPPTNVIMNTAGVNTSRPGVYEAYYYYTGLSGEVATAILTVIVE